MSRVVAIVPVRKGSQRVPQKNVRPFAGTTLLDLKLEVLKGISRVDDVVVSTAGTVLLTNSTPALASLSLVGTLSFSN